MTLPRRFGPSEIAGIVAIAFGLLTIVSGGTALFGGAKVQEAVGQAVPFVLWFNFMAGFAYVTAGAGLLGRRRWAIWLSLGILGATAVILVLFLAHVIGGGAYEMRTMGAMFLRLLVWAGISGAAMHFGRDP